MDARHQEYIEYYRARLRRYDGDPHYPRTAAAQRAMLGAIETAPDLESVGQRVIGEALHVKCAVALVWDQEEARAKLYGELDEPVRAAPHRQVVDALAARDFTDVAALNTMVSETLDRSNAPITADEVPRDEFWNALKVLEDLAIWETAEVPDEWKAERAEFIAETRARMAETAATSRDGVRKFVPDYAPDWDALWQTRHRRRLPLPDDTLRRRIAEYLRAIGGK